MRYTRILFFLAGVASLGACGSDGGSGETPAPDASVQCTSNRDCTDDNLCTFEWCDDTGTCQQEDSNEGEQCDDGDLCTTGDVCVTGTCAATPTDCSGLSDFCNAGFCNAETGECQLEPKADGETCDDGVFCTDGDVCSSGECLGETRDCSELDNACAQGVCNEETAQCVVTFINEAGSCDDGLFCTDGDTCTEGVCSGSAIDCSSETDQCNTGTCDEEADACVGVPVTNGTQCSDGLFCTPADQCIEGTCTGSGAVDCSGLDSQCSAGFCDEDADACNTAPANEGNGCNDGKFCTSGETCTSGVCTGGTTTACNDGDMCTTDTCEPVSDACVFNPISPIPDAEGPPGDPTCSDEIDNDCDGNYDGDDVDCTGCASDAECDDGNDCTTDTCSPGSNRCEHTGLTGNTCDDRNACTDGDICTSGTCGGSPKDCSAESDACNVGVCNIANGSCVKSATNEGGTCSDGLYCTNPDTCTAGTCGGPARDCSSQSDSCHVGSCDEDGNACVPTERPDGTACDRGFCTDGETCTGGLCTGGTPHDCADTDSCTADACDEVGDSCTNDTLVIDQDSVVATSATGTVLDVCLVAGSQARVLLWTELQASNGAVVTEATVTIGGQAATESTAQPGTYYVEWVAAASPSSDVVSVEVAACGTTVTLSRTITINNAAANSTLGGTGGCSPMHGNVRIRAVDDTGAPLAGASVMVGTEEAEAFETSPEALFGGSSALASNVATTDSSGYATFYDYAASLDGPITATAGATDHAYMTLAEGNASDLVLSLPETHPTEPTTTTYGNGTATLAFENCGDFDAAMIMNGLEMEALTRFDTDALFTERHCWASGNGLVGDVAIPGNLWIPQQGVALLCFGGNVTEATWTLDLPNTADTGRTQDLSMLGARADAQQVQDALDSGGMAGLLGILNYQRLGFELDETVPSSPTSGRSVSLDDDFGDSGNFQVTYTSIPGGTDVVGALAGDYDGTNGLGTLFLIATDIHRWNAGGSSVAIPNAPLSAAGTPAGVRRVAIITALYLNPEDPDRSSPVAANLAEGTSAVMIRDNGSGGAPIGTGSATATVNDMLDIATQTYTGTTGFRWENATLNGNSPLFSIHELRVRTDTYIPLLSCDTDNEVREQSSVQWIVVRPFDTSCSGAECFVLPTLPSSFPRATAGTQQRSGFEQRIGSGNTCTGSCPVAGESCVDPDGAGGPAPRQCMGGSGTAPDPYYVQQFDWLLHLYDLELAPSFNFNNFDFDDRRMYMTHESTNRIEINE